MNIFRFPIILWRGRCRDREITLELRYLTPIVCAALLVVIHLSGATAATSALLAVALIVIGIAFVWAWQMAHHLDAARRLEARWVQVGDVMEERFTLRNDSELPALWVEIADQSNVPGYNASTVYWAGSRAETHWTHSGQAERRGEYYLGPWSIETGDPFGILIVRITFPQARPLLVYPPIADLPFPPLPRGAALGAFRVNRAAPSPTTNASQVRGYELGDSFRHIHWPSTAHHDKLMVKMFDQEAFTDVWLLVDTDPAAQSGAGNTATAEVGVIVAASLAADLLREGRAVGLLTFAPLGRVTPSRGTGHLWTLLGELARLPTAETRKGYKSLLGLSGALGQAARTLRAGTSVVIITSSGDPAWVSTLAELAWRIAPAVVLIDPAPDGKPVLNHLTALLAEQSIPCRSVQCNSPLSIRPAFGRTRRWEFKTLATGGVVKLTEGVR